MSYLLEAATEMHFPTPHRGLAARLQAVRAPEAGAIARTIEESDAPVSSARYLLATVGAVGVGLSVFTVTLFNKLAKR